MGGYFSREKNEENLYKKAVVGNKYKTIFNYIAVGIALAATTFLSILSFGTILLIDGGITITYLIISFSFSIHERLIKKYLKYLSDVKKRDFKNYLYSFYEKIITSTIVGDIEKIIDDFVVEEEILRKSNEKFDMNRKKFINDSKEFKNKFNVMVIGPT